VKKGDTIFIGQYLFTGSETTSVWLEVIFWTQMQNLFRLVPFYWYFSVLQYLFKWFTLILFHLGY